MRLRFVNPETGEEGKVGEEYILAVDGEGDVWQFGGDIAGEESSWLRPDLRVEIVPEWIPVGERLPEATGLYIVRLVRRFTGEDVAVDTYLWHPYIREFVDPGDMQMPDIFDVTHWMPLPSAEVTAR